MIENKKLIEEIAKKYSLDLLLLFGSRASGKTYKGSDFDLAYLSKANLTLEEEAELILALILLFKSEDIDLINLKKASPLLFYAIFKNCRLLYEKRPLIFASLRAYAFKKYIETKPLYEDKFKRFEKTIQAL